jgi:hypothetical protein
MKRPEACERLRWAARESEFVHLAKLAIRQIERVHDHRSRQQQSEG